MPIYKYRCLGDGCSHEFDEVRSRKDVYDSWECPKCSHSNDGKKSKLIESGIRTTVIGVSKGNYNSGGW